MTSTPTTPKQKPTDWHRRPAGTGGKCPICGLAGKYRGEHRATLESEVYARKWIRRFVVVDGDTPRWNIREVGALWKSLDRGVKTETRAMISKAARLAAEGYIQEEIAKTLGVDVSTISSYRRSHVELWRHDFRIAVARVIEEEKAKPAPEEPNNRKRLPGERWSPAKAAVPAEPGSMDLADFLNTVYVPSRLELRPSTIKQLQSLVSRFSRYLGRPAVLADLTERTVLGFLREYLVLGAAAATVNSKRRGLLALWRCAFDQEMLKSEPRARKIPKAKAPPKIPEAWTPEEVARIIDSAKRDVWPADRIPAPKWWEAFLLVIYYTGERVGAVLKVAPQDVTLDEGWIRILRTKTGRPRFCPLPPDAVAAVRRIHNPDRDRLFPWPNTYAALAKRFRKILKRAGVAYGHARGGLFHKLRRTSGSLVAMHGGDGAKHIGNTARVFEESYLDPRFRSRQNLDCLPRPKLPPLLTHDET